MQVDVLNIEKQKVGSIELPDDIFAVEISDAVVWEQIKAQLASRRRGTHATKKRGEVSGGGIKPYKQKGTGRARQGSSRAPNHVGGGKVFGPQPRDYSYRLPRSARKAALKSALTMKAKEGLVVIDKIDLAIPKTKELTSILDRLEIKNALIVDNENINLKKSARNLDSNIEYKSKYLLPNALNVYDIIGHKSLVLTESALAAVIARARGLSETNAGDRS
ncbi:MAG: 50S ribosomal protein L4 [Deltaproteobacteria bacterium]|nr:50S ribosomal protein L4 [Deltaproteobacteria bacterium]